MDLYKKQFIIFNFRFEFLLPVQSSPEIIIWENFLITTSLTFIIKYGIHCNTFVTTFLHNPSKWILWKLAFSKLTWSYIQYSVKWSIWYGRLKEDGLSSNWTTWKFTPSELHGPPSETTSSTSVEWVGVKTSTEWNKEIVVNRSWCNKKIHVKVYAEVRHHGLRKPLWYHRRSI